MIIYNASASGGGSRGELWGGKGWEGGEWGKVEEGGGVSDGVEGGVGYLCSRENYSCIAKKKLKQPWMTPALLKSVKNKDKLYHKCLGKDKNSHAYNKYIQYRNNFNRIKTIMKQNYYKEILSQYRNDSRYTSTPSFRFIYI